MLSLDYTEFNELLFLIYSTVDLSHDGPANIKFLLVLVVAWRQKATMIFISNFNYFLSLHTVWILKCLWKIYWVIHKIVAEIPTLLIILFCCGLVGGVYIHIAKNMGNRCYNSTQNW